MMLNMDAPNYYPNSYSYNYYYDQVSCINRQIAELEARRDALQHGYCFTGYLNTKAYLDPYNLSEGDLQENS